MDKEEFEKQIKRDPKYWWSVCEGLERLRIGNKNDIRQSQTEAFEELNKVVGNFSKYLFTIAALLIPIIFSLVTSDSIRKRLDQRDSVWISVALILLSASLVAGLVHMISEYKYNKNWLKNCEKRLKIWASSSFWPSVPTPENIGKYMMEYEETRNKTDEIQSEIDRQSNLLFLVLQGIFLLFGMAPLVMVAIKLLP